MLKNTAVCLNPGLCTTGCVKLGKVPKLSELWFLVCDGSKVKSMFEDSSVILGKCLTREPCLGMDNFHIDLPICETTKEEIGGLFLEATAVSRWFFLLLPLDWVYLSSW